MAFNFGFARQQLGLNSLRSNSSGELYNQLGQPVGPELYQQLGQPVGPELYQQLGQPVAPELNQQLAQPELQPLGQQVEQVLGVNPNELSNTFNDLDSRQNTLYSQLQTERDRLVGAHGQLQESTGDITAESLTQPLREAFDTASADIKKLALAESEIATEEIRAIQSNNPDSRAGARLAQRETIRGNLRRSIADSSANTLLQFGSALTTALQQGTGLELQAQAQINQSAQNISQILGDFLKTQNAFALGSAGLKADAILRTAELGVQREGLQVQRQGLQVELAGLGVQRQGMQVDLAGLGVQRQGMQVDLAGLGVQRQGLQVELAGLGVQRQGLQVELQRMQAQNAQRVSGSRGTVNAVSAPSTKTEDPYFTTPFERTFGSTTRKGDRYFSSKTGQFLSETVSSTTRDSRSSRSGV